MSFVVTARVKEILSKHSMRTGGDLIDMMDKHVEEKLKKGAWRAKENKRQTVYGCDY